MPATHYKPWLGPAAVALLLFAASANWFVANGAQDTTRTASTTGDPAKGKKIFVVKCIACHKADGSGGVKVTTVATPDWRDSTRMSDPKFDDSYLRDCISNGRVQSGMVPWSKQGMKAADIEHLIAYIRTFSATAAKAKSSKKAK